MRLRGILVPIGVLIASSVIAAVAASPAFADPPVGTLYCMDGTETFAIWDAASAHVTNKTVTLHAGVITIGEHDPAHTGRSAVRQYYDALETSDADGNYGIDTTIANYAIHRITVGACPPEPPPENLVFLCYSKFQVDPGAWPVSQAESLMGSGYWEPAAVSGTVTGGTNIGGFHLVCNPAASAAPDGSYVGGDGTIVQGPDWGAGYYPRLG